MRKEGNLAILPMNEPTLKDGDGSNGGTMTTQITIDIAENGWILTVHTDSPDADLSKVFLRTSTEVGPRALIQELVDALGVKDKVRLEK